MNKEYVFSENRFISVAPYDDDDDFEDDFDDDDFDDDLDDDDFDSDDDLDYGDDDFDYNDLEE